MHDINTLENEWKLYRSKKRKPFYLFMLLLIVLLLTLFIFNKNRTNFSVVKSFFKSLSMSTDVKINGENSILLNNALNFLEIRKQVVKSSPLTDSVLVDIPVLVREDKDSEIQNSKNSEKLNLNIIGTSSLSAYEDVEKRFLQSKNIDDALFLAQSYYKRLNYEKAIFWSREVNKIDENHEESIFIFVKSKIKLGQKNEATLLLNSYLKKSNSETGQNLLNKIEKDLL